ncbi:MAG: CsgG/HfaB family protein [Elusimicrobiota bacterium]
MKKYFLLFFFFSLLNNTLIWGGKLPDNIVLSVMYFDNTSKNLEFDWMRKGVADLIISDISKTKQIQVVQRENLQKVLVEQKLALSGVINKDSAIEVGNTLGANVVLLGSFIIFDDKINIDGQIIDIKTSEIMDSVRTTGNVSNFLLVEKKFSIELLKTLGVKLTPENQKTIEQLETENLDAVKYNYEGISAVDDEQIKKALELFKKATQMAPEYKSAQENYAYFSKNVSGENIFSEAFSQLSNKTDFLTTSKKLLKDLADEIIKNGFVIKIGEPNISTNLNDFDNITVKVNVEISLDDSVREKIYQVEKTLEGSVIFLDEGIHCIAFKGDGAGIDNEKEAEYGLNMYFYNLLCDMEIIFTFVDSNGHIIAGKSYGNSKKFDNVSSIVDVSPFFVTGIRKGEPGFYLVSFMGKSIEISIVLPLLPLAEAKKLSSIKSKVKNGSRRGEDISSGERITEEYKSTTEYKSISKAMHFRGNLRNALTIYYDQNEGNYPSSLEELKKEYIDRNITPELVSQGFLPPKKQKYIDNIPIVKLNISENWEGNGKNTVKMVTSSSYIDSYSLAEENLRTYVDNTTTWLYDWTTGIVILNCNYFWKEKNKRLCDF